MGRKTTKCLVALSEHTMESNEWNAIFFHFKVQSCISLEISFPTIRIKTYNNSNNTKVLAQDLNLAD